MVLSSSVLVIPTMLAFAGASSVVFRLSALTALCLLLLHGALLLHRVMLVAEQTVGALGVISIGAIASLRAVAVTAWASLALRTVAIGA